MNVHHKHFEDELMGSREGEGLIGDSIERNMNQMIDVLRSKISAMGHAANNRIRLCEEDLKKNSKESSDQAPKIMEDFDESSNVRGAREVRNSLNSHKDNLVSSEGVFIDAAHLVIRTKVPTDAAKKLEQELEESCASSSLREMESLRGKMSMSRTEKTKKVEQKRFEAKKILRNKSEKDLQANMENFLTRSVMDSDIQFRAPSLPPIPGALAHKRRNSVHPSAMARNFEMNHSNVSTTLKDYEACVEKREEGDCKLTEEKEDKESGKGGSQHSDAARWPISIKWPQNDSRSSHTDNAEGEMDPVLLLRYSIEKINVPSGEKMFRWLCKQSPTQDYFVYLFWLVKVKFFEKDSHPENELFLLRGLSVQYVKIMELLATHGHGAEYEKDFAYQYLPYILSNAVYFGFFYLCPGSRHIYTKGFKKSILLQVVKVMHGFQLCTASVKLLWLRLFPEDTHEVEDEGEDLGEMFPVQIAIGYDQKCSEGVGSSSGSRSRSRSGSGSHGGSGSVVTHVPPSPGLISDQDFLDLSHSCLSPTSRRTLSSPPSAGRVRITSPGDDAWDESRERAVDLLLYGVPASGSGSSSGSGSWSPRTVTGRVTSGLPSPVKLDQNVCKFSNSSQPTDMNTFLQHLVLPSDTQHQWDDRRTTFSQTNLVPLRRVSLQSMMRRNSTNASPGHHKQQGSASEAAPTVPGMPKRFRGPSNGPNVQTILRISVDTALAPENSSGHATPAGLRKTRTGNNANTGPLSCGARPSEGIYNLTGKHGSMEGASYISKSGNPSPLARTLLKSTSLRQGQSPGTLTRRQSSEALNMKSVSPLMQEYFASSVCAPVMIDIGAQMMRRTVPISWCATGGADTHRKRLIQTDLHQTSTDRRKEAAKEFLKASYLGKKNRLDGLRNIDSKCVALLQSDAATIGRFSLDLVKRQQQRKPKGDFSHSSPVDALTSDAPSVSDVTLAANFDPADLDAFLARI